MCGDSNKLIRMFGLNLPLTSIRKITRTRFLSIRHRYWTRKYSAPFNIKPLTKVQNTYTYVVYTEIEMLILNF